MHADLVEKGLEQAPAHALTLAFGRDRSRRAGSVADDVPRPDHRTGMSAIRRRLPWIVWIVVLIAFSMQWFNASWLQADTSTRLVISQTQTRSHVNIDSTNSQSLTK